MRETIFKCDACKKVSSNLFNVAFSKCTVGEKSKPFSNLFPYELCEDCIKKIKNYINSIIQEEEAEKVVNKNKTEGYVPNNARILEKGDLPYYDVQKHLLNNIKTLNNAFNQKAPITVKINDQPPRTIKPEEVSKKVDNKRKEEISDIIINFLEKDTGDKDVSTILENFAEWYYSLNKDEQDYALKVVTDELFNTKDYI